MAEKELANNRPLLTRLTSMQSAYKSQNSLDGLEGEDVLEKAVNQLIRDDLQIGSQTSMVFDNRSPCLGDDLTLGNQQLSFLSDRNITMHKITHHQQTDIMAIDSPSPQNENSWLDITP